MEMYNRASAEDARELFRRFEEDRAEAGKITGKGCGSPEESRARTEVTFTDGAPPTVTGTHGADDITPPPARFQGKPQFAGIHPEGGAATEYFDPIKHWRETE